MSDIELIFIEMRLSVLEKVLCQNPNVKSTFKDTYLKIKQESLIRKPAEWEQLVSFIDDLLEETK